MEFACCTKVTFYRRRSQDLFSHFSTNGKLCYCHDVSALFQSIGMIHDQTNWTFFIDSSKESIKALFLHNGNRYSFVPIAYSTTLEETYCNLQSILVKLNYHSHLWYVCADIKVVALLYKAYNLATLNTGFPRSGKVENFVKTFPDREKVGKSAS